MESNRVHIYGQGIFDERGNRIDDEVLVRGVRPDGSIVFPDELLEGIGKIGHYDTFDWLVIENACAYISAAGKHNETYGVNVNPITLCRPDFFEKMSGMFRKYGVNPRNIIVEILECGEFEGSDSATVDKTLKSLRELGVRIAIDDYPAQSNTLARVSMLENIDIVKIDGIHVMEMFNTCESCEAADACSAFIASSSSRNQDMCLRDLKHDYKLETLVFSMRFLKYNYPHLKFFAERVEDANVLAFLKRLGFVEGFQGYHFEKPRLLASSDTLRESFQGIRLSDALEERASAGLPKVSEVVPGDAGNVLLVSDSALSDEILRADSFAASAVELSAFFRAGNSIADVNSTYSTSEAMETVLKHLNADRISFYSDDGTKISVETYSTGGTFEVTEIPSFPEHSRVDKKNLNLYRLSLGNSEPERFGFDISRYPVPGEGDDIVVRVGEGRYVGIDDSERAVYRTEAAKLNFLLLFVSAVSRW